ncbi:hypothetical protein BGZ94_007744 [Podila epigama]|nr:hypothetical protein BGZ94_007744 [Podila epigama]
MTTTGFGDNQQVVLAQSNKAPGSLADLTWTVVAATPQKNLYYLQGLVISNNFVCHIDDQGVFTILSTVGKTTQDDATLVTVPRGYRYDTVSKTWSNIDMSPDYKWKFIGGSALFSVTPTSGAGTGSTLFHVYDTSVTANTITAAVYDPSSRTMVERSETWSIPAASGEPVQFAASNDNRLYVISKHFLQNKNYLTILPITPNGAAPTPLTSLSIDVAPACDMSFSTPKAAVREKVFYAYCSDAGKTRFSFFTYDGTKMSTEVNVTKATVSQFAGFLPIGPQGSPATWAFLYGTNGIYGVTLTGPQAGDWQTVPYKFNMTGDGGRGDNGGGGRGGSGIWNSGLDDNNNDGLSTGAIAGIVAGAVALALILFFCIRRRRHNKKIQKASQVMQETFPPYAPSYPQQYIQQQQQQQHGFDLNAKHDPVSTVQQGPFLPQQQQYSTTYYQPHNMTAITPQAPQTLLSSHLSPHTSTISSPANTYVSSPQSYSDSSTVVASSPSLNSTSYPPFKNSNNPQQYDPSHLPQNPSVFYSTPMSHDPRAPQQYPAPAAPQDHGQNQSSDTSKNPRAPQERDDYAQ